MYLWCISYFKHVSIVIWKHNLLSWFPKRRRCSKHSPKYPVNAQMHSLGSTRQALQGGRGYWAPCTRGALSSVASAAQREGEGKQGRVVKGPQTWQTSLKLMRVSETVNAIPSTGPQRWGCKNLKLKGCGKAETNFALRFVFLQVHKRATRWRSHHWKM